jgi:multicomponent Na+:H+ antiporter subunit E
MQRDTRWDITRIVFTAAYLMVGWILFTWSLAPHTVLLGAGWSIIVSLFTFRYFFQEHEAARRSLLPHAYLLVVYLAVLTFSMYVASFKMLWHVIRGRTNPGVVHFRTRLRADIARVALTNAITLTPGTITLDLDDDHLVVHWLDAKTTHSRYAGQLIAGAYERLLRRIWV